MGLKKLSPGSDYGRRVRTGGRLTREHVRLVEIALGKRMPPNAVVHHADGDKSNNARGNLVACQDQAYHFLLHVRTDALNATGDASQRRCRYCSRYDRPENLTFLVRKSGRNKGCDIVYHRACSAKMAALQLARRRLLSGLAVAT